MVQFAQQVFIFVVVVLLQFGAGEYRCRAPRRLVIPNGKVNTSDPEYRVGAALTFDCNENYYMDQSDSMVCTKKGWSPRRPPLCKPNRCLSPSVPENGMMHGRHRDIGRSTRFWCKPGFKLIGSKQRTCLRTGEWSGQLSICDDGGSDCRNPGVPLGGRRIGDKFNIGDTVEFRCIGDLILRGSNKRTCSTNKTWTGKPVHCGRLQTFYIPSVNETAFQMLQNIVKPLEKTTCANFDHGCGGLGRSIDINPMKGLDVVFLVDSSSSIGEDNFKMGLRFACHLIQRLGVDYSPGGTRVAMITYSSRSDLVFNLGDPTASSVKNACKKIIEIRYSGGGTGTRFGLKKARDMVVPVMREDSVKALIMIADGRSNFGGNPYGIANNLRTVHDVDVYAIGIGKKISMTELKLLTHKPSQAFQLRTYEDFDHLMEKIISYDYSKCGISTFDEPSGRISGGSKAKAGQWPWQVSICRIAYKKNRFVGCRHICGGSLVEKDVILTAAHCFYKRNLKGQSIPDAIANSYRVQIGQLYIDQSSSKLTKFHHQINTIELNPNYEKATLDNDIALIVLKDQVEWSPNIRPLCLPLASHSVKPDTSGYVAGWGNTKKGKVSERLLYTRLNVKKHSVCQNGTDFYNGKTNFCAGRFGGDTCKGDSGGSFVSRVPRRSGEKSWTAVGIVSKGDLCVKKTYQGYYTRVAEFLAWLTTTVDKLRSVS